MMITGKQINFLRVGADVKRFHTLFTIQQETVGHHSHGVALICLLLEPRASVQLLTAALLHDLSEQATGDIPSPAKRLCGVAQQVTTLENQVMAEAGFVMPHLYIHEERVLKLADIAHGALFCKREMRLGNSEMSHVFANYMNYAKEIGLESAEEISLFNIIEGM